MADTTLIRSTHPAAFRSGEWAKLLTTAPSPGRDCFVVEFPDAKTDFWVVDDDAAGYEFMPAPRPKRTTRGE